MPAAMPMDAMALSRLSGGARRPTTPTSDVTPVPLTPMPNRTPLISRSVVVAAAYMK
jgi:hypothetical protein